MVELIERLDAEVVQANLLRIQAEIARVAPSAPGRAGRGDGVEVLAATKYVALAAMPALAQAGVRLVGENRAQEMQEKASRYGELFEWDFIGALQSRRVRLILPHVRYIHSVGSQSAIRELARRRELSRPGAALLLEVNVAGEPGKAGIAPAELAAYLDEAPLPVVGLMAMPPLTTDPEHSRPWFAALRELADRHGLEHLSMGTSQDYLVTVEEGATIVRIGTSLYGRDGRTGSPATSISRENAPPGEEAT